MMLAYRHENGLDDAAAKINWSSTVPVRSGEFNLSFPEGLSYPARPPGLRVGRHRYVRQQQDFDFTIHRSGSVYRKPRRNDPGIAGDQDAAWPSIPSWSS